MRILFDQGTPVPLRNYISGHVVSTAYEQRWSALSNGELLSAAENAGFDLLVTTDQNLRYQQNLATRRIAILVLRSTSCPRIRLHVDLICEQIDLVNPGLAADVALAAFILIVSIAALAIAGGENRLIRRFAYFAFASETIYVVGETLGSLLGSSGFLFLGGLALAVIAYAVMKLEKRFKAGEGRS